MNRPGREAGRAVGIKHSLNLGQRAEAEVLDAVADMTEPRGPTSVMIAKRTGRHRRGVRGIINKLLLAGMLHEENRGGSHTFLTLTPLGYAHREALAQALKGKT